MKRLVVLLTLGAVIVIATMVAAAGPQGTAAAALHQISGSGVRARILFLDSGSSTNGLIVSGRATGLNPTQTYISLIYDNGSVPSGPTACEPTSNALSEAQMFVGTWEVAGDGTGTLFAIKTGDSYAPLSQFRTISVRVVLGPLPQDAVLQACGLVRRTS